MEEEIMKKYKFTGEKKEEFGVVLNRIESLVDFETEKGLKIRAGDAGGWIENEENLSHLNNAWVSGDARVSGNAGATHTVYTSSYVHVLTLTDNHIKFGCEQRTINEWREFLDSDEIIQTPRSADKFKLIRMSLELAIECSRQRE